MNIQPFLDRYCLKAEIIDLGVPMPSSADAAQLMGVDESRIFKSLLLKGKDGRVVLVVLCGNQRVDLKKVAALTGLKELRFAEAEVVMEMTGFPPGGTPPVGHARKIPVIVDSQLFAHTYGYAGAGESNLLLKIRPQEIIEVSEAAVSDISK